ncbi:putative glycosyltransferase, type 1 (homolog to trehalose synthase) (plasmid) [Natrialba magadii ATCC 43099]|uniref:Glycosyltransferase, type 1 (Homolog to trehalose synthase) n=1 Tax=Natrialba magadii (strain ATCC 43099 / DSM 3394 / CCM 3739 / CIP 104546 / IAM 13178 / JCM 8861 / NBRC 102185 / NCIMB 2190 / MS3) TaxID=547559 RepID=D3T1B4_NATMM|nr:glycosyltransferase [Natrialba magadii]ADD07373.1 putative glycosyltransferase, type 1 (homolog to trehalose synthase) [Natrialba magadii ATCC 43099]ELY32443.1 group 1 glycosyl transferase [Natrialba magadii ATCC 43099]
MHAPSLSDQTFDAYTDVTGRDRLERLRSLADTLADSRILHVNSTATGGGVAELLRSIVPVCNDLGIDTDWLVMDADDEFFEVTKAMHNALQGSGPPLTEDMKATYRTVNEQNARELADHGEEYDLAVIHDPQPLGMLDQLEEMMPETVIVWRCHIDLTDPTAEYLAFVSEYTAQVDHGIFSRSDYIGETAVPGTSIIYPSIDPVAEKNRSLEAETIATMCDRLDPLSFEDPLVTQISRFDPWKDQFGTLEAYRRASEDVADLQLALVGGMAGDDPEGLELYEQVAKEAATDPNVHVLTDLSDIGVNVLQRESDVVVQKSLREGFGLVVSEALWKRTPVVGSDVGGIPLQIVDEETGYLVAPDDATGAGERVVDLLENDERRARFGENAREHVQEHFLLPRQLVELLDVLADELEYDQ